MSDDSRVEKLRARDRTERGGHIEYVHFPYRDLDEQRRRQAA